MGRIQEHIAATCKLALIRCGDWRLDHRMGLRSALDHVYGAGADFDTLSLAGSCYALVHEAKAIQEFFLGNIATFVSLHHSETVVIVQHTECGEYLKHMTFEDDAHELRVLSEDIWSAACILRERFPNVDVRGHIAFLRDDQVASLEHVAIPKHVIATPNEREQARA